MDKPNSRDLRAKKTPQGAEVLKESEDHCRMLFENSRDGIVMVDNTGRFVKANSAYCAMLGYTIDELRGMENFYEVTPEKWRDWEREEIWFNRIFKTGYSGVYEKEYIRKNGEVFPVELNSFAIFGKDGRPVILFGIARDITERKSMESALKKSEANLRKAEKIAKIGHWEWNILTNELTWSDEVYHLYGLDPLKGKPSYDIVIQTLAPECRDRFIVAVDDALKLGKHFEGEYRIINLDGMAYHTHTIGEVARDNDGRPVAMFGIVQDITERNKAEEELRKTNELFSMFMLHSPIYTYIKEVTPTESRVLYASENFQEMIGIPGSEMVGKTMEELFSPEFAAKITADDWAVVSGGYVMKVDEDLNGRYYTTIKYPITIADKTLLAGYTIDITERKQAESALREREKQLAESQRIAHIGSWEHNPKTGEIHWSDELFRLLGLDPAKDQADFGTFFAMIHPDDQPLLKAAVETSLREKKPFDLEYRFIIPGEPVKMIHARAELVPDAAGELSVLSGTGQDITERKKAEKELRESQRFLETIFETVPTCIKLITADGILQSMNRIGLEMIEAKSLDQVRGQCVYPMVSEEYREAFKALTQNVFKGISGTLEFKMIGLKGRPLWLFTKAVPLHNEKGEIVLSLATTIDITERKKAEEALAQSYAELTKRNKELKDALVNVKTLSSLLPICSSCKKIRDDKGYWKQIELYITEHTDTLFSHGMCPECEKKAYEELEKLKNKKT